MTARKGFSTTHRDSHATRHASNTRGRAGARCPRCRSRHVTTMHRRDKSGVLEISLSLSLSRLLLRPNGDDPCVYIYISLSFTSSYIFFLFLSLLFLSFSPQSRQVPYWNRHSRCTCRYYRNEKRKKFPDLDVSCRITKDRVYIRHISPLCFGQISIREAWKKSIWKFLKIFALDSIYI